MECCDLIARQSNYAHKNQEHCQTISCLLWVVQHSATHKIIVLPARPEICNFMALPWSRTVKIEIHFNMK